MKWRKNTENKNSIVANTKNGKIMLLSKCIKQQEASRLLSSFGIKTLLSKIPLVGLFCFKSIKQVKLIKDINLIK